MKELSIEQKAKAYDEAIERAKEINNEHKAQPFDVMLKVFPELKESGDEKIRKELLNHLKAASYGKTLVVSTLDYKTWADWLEKQVPAYLNHDDEIMIKQLTEYFTTGKGLQNTNDTVVEWLIDVKRKLERQGEQKHKIQPKFKIGDIIRFKGNETLKGEVEAHKIVDYDNELYVFADGTTDLFCEQDLYELVEQKPTNKVEPKFHEDEWVVNNTTLNLCHILKIEHGQYICDDCSFPITKENEYHIWTIQDAKNGDVLVNDTILIIVDHLGTFENRPIIYSWYFADSKKFYGMGTSEPDRWAVKGFIPATKEQRDLMFDKMHEAGYLWNSKNKQLLCLKAEPDKVQPVEWSKKDDKIIETAISFLEKFKKAEYENVVEGIDWLRTLKDRVLPQPKQEWSEEDKEVINIIISLLEEFSSKDYFTRKNCIDWLKSLRPF